MLTDILQVTTTKLPTIPSWLSGILGAAALLGINKLLGKKLISSIFDRPIKEREEHKKDLKERIRVLEDKIKRDEKNMENMQAKLLEYAKENAMLKEKVSALTDIVVRLEKSLTKK